MTATEQNKNFVWRQNLKMGDPVTLSSVHGKTAASVMRTTATQIIVVVAGNERRYSRSNGRRLGVSAGGPGGWISMPEATK